MVLVEIRLVRVVLYFEQIRSSQLVLLGVAVVELLLFLPAVVGVVYLSVLFLISSDLQLITVAHVHDLKVLELHIVVRLL